MMSTVIHSINYSFDPDNITQQLCEAVARKLEGNGITPADITAESAESFEVSIISAFNWAVEVSVKSANLANKYSKNVQFHKSLNDAKTMAKQQGLHILRNSLGKIELINNIEQDPLHYFCHASAKLSGGPSHAILSKCSQQCNQGQLVCPRCNGKGTHKATTKKEDFLGTSGNFAVQNSCPTCKGKGTITCSTCEGSGVQTHLYSINVNATRQSQDKVEASAAVKQNIEQFLSHTSHQELLTYVPTPEISQLEDIDQNHCAVRYKIKTRALRLSLSIHGKPYTITGFGEKGHLISLPAILDDVLPEKLQRIIGVIPGLNSTGKCLKIKNMPLFQKLIGQSLVSDNQEAATQVLLKQSDGLLTEASAVKIISLLQLMKKHLTPRFSIAGWLPFILIGMLSGFYFGLGSHKPEQLATIVSIHLLATLVPGYFFSRQLTRYRRNKLKQDNNVPYLERLPVLITVALILISIFTPSMLNTETQWKTYFQLQQYYYRMTSKPATDKEPVMNQDAISKAQQYLKILGYREVELSGEYDSATDKAIKNFQAGLGLRQDQFLDYRTLELLSTYSVMRQRFNTN